MAERLTANAAGSRCRTGITRRPPSPPSCAARSWWPPRCSTAPRTAKRFPRYLTDTLVPVLTPGDIVILDNLPAHKVATVRDAIESVGAGLLYLPPYSPDFNPIEQAFAKFKVELRSAAARTIPDLWTAIQKAFERFTPSECQNYLAAADTKPTWSSLHEWRRL